MFNEGGNSNAPYFLASFLSLRGLCKMQQAIIGFDATEMLSEMESLGTSEIDFGVEEIEEEDSDVEDGANEDDDDYDEVWFLFSFQSILAVGF
jgi:hypothetical protein